MSHSSRRPAPAFIAVLVGALWGVGRLQVEMMEVCKRPTVSPRGGSSGDQQFAGLNT